MREQFVPYDVWNRPILLSDSHVTFNFKLPNVCVEPPNPHEIL